VFQVAVPLLAVRLTRSASAVALVAVAGRLPWLLFALHAGALADRLDRRRTMIVVNAARGAALVGFAALVEADVATLAWLYVLAFLLGVGETLFDTSAQSIMPSVVRRDQLTRANGRLYAAELTTNQFIGPPLGGAIAGVALAWAFAGSGAAYVLAAVALLAVRGRFRAERHGPPTRLRSDIAEGLRYLWGHGLLRRLALLVGAMNLVASAAFALFVLFAVEPGPLGLSELGFGVLLTAGAIGSLAGTVLAPRVEQRAGRRRVLVGAVALMGLPFLAVATTTSVVLVGATAAIGGAASVTWNVVTVSLRQRIVPDRLLGRVNSGYRLLAWGTMPLGAALGGLAGEVLGVRTVFGLAAAASVALVWPALAITDAAIDAAEGGDGA